MINVINDKCQGPLLPPEVSDETGALLVYSCLITYKSFSHRPTSTEHAELLGNVNESKSWMYVLKKFQREIIWKR